MDSVPTSNGSICQLKHTALNIAKCLCHILCNTHQLELHVGNTLVILWKMQKLNMEIKTKYYFFQILINGAHFWCALCFFVWIHLTHLILQRQRPLNCHQWIMTAINLLLITAQFGELASLSKAQCWFIQIRTSGMTITEFSTVVTFCGQCRVPLMISRPMWSG